MTETTDDETAQAIADGVHALTEPAARHWGTMFWDWDHDGYAVSCSCGYTTAAHGSRSDAQREHDEHAAQRGDTRMGEPFL